jgi:hypothetical protein
MIRFVEVRGYYGSLDTHARENDAHFAFIDTITDRFLDFKGDQFFGDREDFEMAAKNYARTLEQNDIVERCRRLIQNHVK